MWSIELEFITDGRDIEDIIVEIQNEYELGAVVTHSGLVGEADYKVQLSGTSSEIGNYLMREYAIDADEFSYLMTTLRRF